MAPSVVIPSAGHRFFSIAGLGIEFESRLAEGLRFQLPEEFQAFEYPSQEVHLQIIVGSQNSLRPARGGFVHESRLNWRLATQEGRALFECYYPPSSGLLVTAEAQDGFRRYNITFDESTWRTLRNSARSPLGWVITMELPFPLDQLLILPVLARMDGFLVHACAAVVDGRALVFAGHSGDGKTTLARMLAAEGLDLLSDERVAVRWQDGVLMAYGTPWPGEGNIVSPSGYPLGGVFLLRKAQQHRIRPGRPSMLLAELLARSIVPYYFPEETARIVRLAHELATTVPLAELHFSLEPGLLPVLLQVQERLRETALA